MYYSTYSKMNFNNKNLNQQDTQSVTSSTSSVKLRLKQQPHRKKD